MPAAGYDPACASIGHCYGADCNFYLDDRFRHLGFCDASYFGVFWAKNRTILTIFRCQILLKYMVRMVKVQDSAGEFASAALSFLEVENDLPV